MALVNVVNMSVLDNPTNFLNPFQFEITFECLSELDDDLEWKVLYVGNAQDCKSDVVLDEILVGPVPVGVNKFCLQADAPLPSQLNQDDVLGVTVVLVTCSYREREFVRVGYYVNNEYTGDYEEAKGPPKPLDYKLIQRQILADKPRVTKFPIPWGNDDANQQMEIGGSEKQEVETKVAALEAAAAAAESNDAAMGEDDKNDEAEEAEEETPLGPTVSSE